MIIEQRRLGVLHARGEQLQGLEDTAPTLAHIDGADPSRPLVHVMEQEMVDPLQLLDRPLGSEWCRLQLQESERDPIILSGIQRLPAMGV
jgi:hypothetical protein